jgi:hypothetical protein
VQLRDTTAHFVSEQSTSREELANVDRHQRLYMRDVYDVQQPILWA